MNEILAVFVAIVLIGGTASVWYLLRPQDPDEPRRSEPTPTRTPPVPGGPSMYDRLGVDAIRVAVDQFYHRILGDPTLAMYFRHMSHADLARLNRHQGLLIGQILGGPVRFELHQLANHHRHLGVSREAYWRAVGHLGAVLTGLQVDRDIVLHILSSLYDVQNLVIADGPAAMRVPGAVR